MQVKLTSLYIYPVKGFAAVALREAVVTSRGLQHDRRFMVVDPDGGFISQRELPLMATVWTEIEGETLRLAAADAGEVSLPLAPDDGEAITVRVWKSTCAAIAPSPAVDQWLTEYLGTDCRLVYMPESTRRDTNAAYGGPGHIVSFADGYPFLLTNEASLADLNARMARPIPMNRFRPNFVVAGAPAFAEDSWTDFALGDVRLRMVKPCGRCQVPTTDQATGEVTGPEPLATLTAYRNSPEFGATFGMNAVPTGSGVVRAGDAVSFQ